MERWVAELAYDGHAATAERPVWDTATRTLLWVDVPAGEVHRFDPAAGNDATVIRLDEPVGCASLRRDGGYVVGARSGFALFDSGGREPSARIPIRRPNSSIRINDGLPDPTGRYVAGTLDDEGAAGVVFSLSKADGRYDVTVLVGGARESNGLDWSTDGSRMYWIDTPTRRVDVFDYDAATGAVRNRRPFVSLADGDGVPDGLIVDSHDGVWVALYGAGKVRRYDEAGRPHTDVIVPVDRPTCPTFGGDDLRDLYITSQRVDPAHPDRSAEPHAGAIFACRTGFEGLRARAFAG